MHNLKYSKGVHFALQLKYIKGLKSVNCHKFCIFYINKSFDDFLIQKKEHTNI